MSMLRHNPKERPSAKRVLMHPWLQKFVAPEGKKEVPAPAPAPVLPTPAPVVHRKSVDDSVFVDDAAPVVGREVDTNPALQRQGHVAPDRVDSNATWMSKNKRTLRPTHRPQDVYESIHASPTGKTSSVRTPSVTRARPSRAARPSQAVPARRPGRAVELPSRPAPKASHMPTAGYSSKAKMNMDAGVVFAAHKPVQQQRQYGAGTILEVHQHHQRSTRQSSYEEDAWEDDGRPPSGSVLTMASSQYWGSAPRPDSRHSGACACVCVLPVVDLC